MKKYLKTLNNKKLKSLKDAHKARQDWQSMHALATEILLRVKDEADKIRYYDFLYIIDDQHSMVRTTPHFAKFIQFYMGSRISGRVQQEFNQNGQLIRNQLEIIKGGAMVISQAPNGQVVFAMFPDTIENQPSEYHFVQSIFKNPGKVKYHHIKEAAEDFLKFLILTGPDYRPNIIERVEIYMIQKKYKADVWPFTKSVFSWGLRILSFMKGVFIFK